MKFTVMTFNLDYNKGLKNLKALTEACKPDIICLQEINTSSENLSHVESYGYQLCDFANSRVRWGNIYGVATFFANSHIKEVRSDAINLPSGIVEVVDFILHAGRRQRTVLKTIFTIDEKQFTLINIHLSPYTTNRLRDKQMHETFQHLNLGNEPTIVQGDFNYPYGRSKFEEIFHQYDLKEATTNIRSTFRSSIPFIPFKFKLDYVLYKGLNHVSTEAVQGNYSDHLPILSTFSI